MQIWTKAVTMQSIFAACVHQRGMKYVRVRVCFSAKTKKEERKT